MNLYFNTPTIAYLVPSNLPANTSLAQALLRQSGLPALSAVDMIISIEPER